MKISEIKKGTAYAYRRSIGRNHSVLGHLGRALQDAWAVQRGLDPERPSEKAVRMKMEARDDR